ncbi:Glu/Leu/Phe/Val dehydrogenase dimerization domain-containing protein [Engelhardtia mirabilis]
MSIRLLDAMAREDFEEVVAVQDRRSGLRAVVALHDTSAGPAFGGIRRWNYASEASAALDCLRLARAMTWKCVLAGLPAGGAKTVVLDHGGLDPESAYRHLGRVIERMGGRYYTGPDVNTGERELAWLAAETRYATDPGPEGPQELAESTAAGVFAGIAAGLRHLDGEEDWSRRSVVIQGLGSVGLRLARRLVEQGARVVGADIDERTAQVAVTELGIETVAPGDELDVPCDVFSPNALGGLVHDLTLVRLRARVVCGGANNVLASAAHGDRLHARGILFVPDFMVNAGALIRGALFHLEGRREPVVEIQARVDAVATELLALARELGRPPSRVAVAEASRRLAARRNRLRGCDDAAALSDKGRVSGNHTTSPADTDRKDSDA